MKILQTNLKDWSVLGINANQRTYNERNLLVLSLFGCGAVLACVHFFYKAETFQESSKSILMVSIMMTGVINFSITVEKTREFFDFLDDAEQIMDGSKSEFQ